MKEEPKDFESEEMDEGMERGVEDDFGGFQGQPEFVHDGLYQGDGDYEGMEEGVEEEEEEEEEEGEEMIDERGGIYPAGFVEAYPEIGGEYDHDE